MFWIEGIIRHSERQTNFGEQNDTYTLETYVFIIEIPQNYFYFFHFWEKRKKHSGQPNII